MQKQTAIVVGAGIGGIATAARLAKNGYDVTVLEKNNTPGGRCNQIVRDGHRFDIGPTLFLMPEVWEETFAALGEKMSDHLDLRRIDPTYKVHFDDGLQLELTSNIGKMQTQLEKVEKTAFTGFLNYIAEGSKHYKLSLEKFVGRNFYNIFEYFSLANLPLIFQLKALGKHYTNTGRFFKDERLKAAFTFQNMYLGLSPYDAPATYSLLQYTELAEGVWYPMGGMYAGIQAYVKVAEKLGVKFIYNAQVKRINVERSKVKNVTLENGTKLTADIFIGNADLPYIYDQLLPDRAEAKKLIEEKLYTCSTIMFYWGVDKEYSQIAHHNIFLGGDYKSSFDKIFNDHTLPEVPSFYVHAPKRTDPAAAPEGQDTLYVLMPVGHLDAHSKQDWEAMVKRARQTVFDRLAKEMGAVDLESHIKFEVVYQPKTWKERFNLVNGAAFGLSHNFWQVGFLRPQNRHKKYKNLYFTGASTHPGTGLPIVLLSARLTTERILKEMGTISVQNMVNAAFGHGGLNHTHFGVNMSLSKNPAFNLKAVLQETNIAADTLRAWERRYGLPLPQRTPGGHRLYSQYDIETIKWLLARQAEGLSISRAVDSWNEITSSGVDPIAGVTSQASSAQKILYLPPETSLDSLRSYWLSACLTFDETKAEQALNQAFAIYPIESVCMEVLQRGLAEIGAQWQENQASVQQEHFTSALALRRINTLISASPAPTRAQTILIGCPAEEDHTFTPLLTSLFLRRRGFNVIYLGANVPNERFEETIKAVRADLVVLVAQQLITAATLQETARMLSEQNIPVAYGGRIFGLQPQIIRSITGFYLGNKIKEAVEQIEDLATSQVQNLQAVAIAQDYEMAAIAFRSHLANIEATLNQSVDSLGYGEGVMKTATEFLGRNIMAALQLGEISLVDDELDWVKSLIKSNHISEVALIEYTKLYAKAVNANINGSGKLVSDWLNKRASS